MHSQTTNCLVMHSQTTMGDSTHEGEFYLVASGISLSFIVPDQTVLGGMWSCMHGNESSNEMTSRYHAPDTVKQ